MFTVHLQGTIPGHTHSYSLDNHHHFQTGKPALVCGNTAAMLGEEGLSWLSKHFQVRQLLCIHPSPCIGRLYMSALWSEEITWQHTCDDAVQVTGDRSTHYGLYPCSSPAAGQPTFSAAPEASVATAAASCCAPKHLGSQCC